jgi:hypothetical protein
MKIINTPMKLLNRLLLLLAAAIALTGTASFANTESFQPRGEGTLRWFGLKIYDARLLTPPEFDRQKIFDQPFVLELTYARKLYGNAIADRSLEEMKKQGIGTAAQHERWLAVMKKTFPDVGANDRLRGEHRPGVGARFYFNGQFIYAIDDPEFSRAFFSIWLSPNTSEPSLRSALLGPVQPGLK